MPRRPNTKPTNIYWLVDTRPETIASGWPVGKPFYCGKTVHSVERRFAGHKCDALKYPTRPISRALLKCGNDIQVKLIEIVPINIDWTVRERHWIRLLRYLNPECANVSNGGDGPAGMIHTEAARKRMSLAKQNCKDETRRKLSEYAKNRPPEVLAKIGAASRGRVDSDETRKRRRESHLGLVKSAETCERIRVAKLNQTEETRRRISKAKRGYKYSEKALEGIRAGQKRRREREALIKLQPPTQLTNRV